MGKGGEEWSASAFPPPHFCVSAVLPFCSSAVLQFCRSAVQHFRIARPHVRDAARSCRTAAGAPKAAPRGPPCPTKWPARPTRRDAKPPSRAPRSPLRADSVWRAMRDARRPLLAQDPKLTVVASTEHIHTATEVDLLRLLLLLRLRGSGTGVSRSAAGSATGGAHGHSNRAHGLHEARLSREHELRDVLALEVSHKRVEGLFVRLSADRAQHLVDVVGGGARVASQHAKDVRSDVLHVLFRCTVHETPAADDEAGAIGKGASVDGECGAGPSEPVGDRSNGEAPKFAKGALMSCVFASYHFENFQNALHGRPSLNAARVGSGALDSSARRFGRISLVKRVGEHRSQGSARLGIRREGPAPIPSR